MASYSNSAIGFRVRLRPQEPLVCSIPLREYEFWKLKPVSLWIQHPSKCPARAQAFFCHCSSRVLRISSYCQVHRRLVQFTPVLQGSIVSISVLLCDVPCWLIQLISCSISCSPWPRRIVHKRTKQGSKHMACVTVNSYYFYYSSVESTFESTSLHILNLEVARNGSADLTIVEIPVLTTTYTIDERIAQTEKRIY